MKKSKLSLLLASTLATSMFLGACSSGSSNNSSSKNTSSAGKLADKQVINVLESAEIPNLDSVMNEDVLGSEILSQVNAGLYRLDQSGTKVIPDLAVGDPEYNADKTVLTIKLRKDAKWSNGDPVTAKDFVYAWQRGIDPKTASPYVPYMMDDKIKNATAISENKAPVSSLGIKAVDDYTLQVTLEKPLPYISSLLTFTAFYPQNQKYVEAQGANYAKDASHLLFNGPFKLTKWEGTAADQWTLEKNADYWDAKDVTLQQVNFNVVKDPQAAVNAYTAGQAEITPRLASSAIISQYQGSKDLMQYLEPSLWWLKMNENNPVLKNLNIRKAIGLAIDRKAYVNNVLANGSVEANYIVPKEFAKNPSTDKFFRDDAGTYLQTDKAQAKKLWEQGLKELGKTSVTFTFVGQDTETAKKEEAFIKDQLEKTLPGLTVNIQSVPFKIRIDREDKQDYDIIFSGWGPDYDDPMTFMDLFLTGGGQNHMSYSDPKYDQLVKAAQTTLATDPNKRWKALQDAEKVLLEDDAALAPLYQRSVNILVNPKVKGLQHNAYSDFSYEWVKVYK
ncbi:peptide ABC transporter substrate-binding protein [Bacillus sp. BRMEA1]|uniref:peptide ABC transporter substrate-binding protein n=1 Tax=Neobacillus endophyticus TaxID=2738405 RepID=UPI001566BD2B|nr:peptide ABC transporter substrate-binding protein [Neobacillus endophyticus]NRD78431.1 peptide ABC transporter substrate-binding protein [Neobacillus endophyticus]